MPSQWFRGLNATTRERYPALLSYAVMLTPDLDEARELSNAAIVIVLGSLRAPRDASAREAALRIAVAKGYLARHRSDASPANTLRADAYATERAPSPYAAPSADDDGRKGVHASRDSGADVDLGIGVSKSDSPLAEALASLSAIERVAAVAWWVDGLGVGDIAELLDVTHHVAADSLHHAGVLLARATGGQAPSRDHFDGTGDIVTVEVSGSRGRR